LDDLVTPAADVNLAPSLAVEDDGTAHVVWQSQDNLYHISGTGTTSQTWDGGVVLTYTISFADLPTDLGDVQPASALALNSAGELFLFWNEPRFLGYNDYGEAD